MSVFAAPPALSTPLGVYRPLSPLAGIRVSPLAFGAMSIGDKWGAALGAMDKEQSFKLLDAFFEAGGNFIDTANAYQDESSEKFLGEWMETRGIRDQIVISTKYTHFYKQGDPNVKQRPSYGGNNTKSMRISVNDSLKKLRTDYIDILYLHWWDWDTGVEEVMNSLHNLVASGKVLYLGVSDTPAWVVSKANQYARDYGKTPFVIYQGQWNVLCRSFEREIVPMARSEGLALAPWDVLVGGKLRTDAEEQRRRETGEGGRKMTSQDWERTETEKAMIRVLEQIANDIGAKSIQAVAIAYVMQKTTHVFPIVGCRKIEHLNANLEALKITLAPKHFELIEKAQPLEPGFPYELIGYGGPSHGLLMNVTLGPQAVSWPLPQAIQPKESD